MPQLSNPAKKFLLYFHTLRFMQLRQIAYKLSHQIRYFLYKRFPVITSRIYLPRTEAPRLADSFFLKHLMRDGEPFIGSSRPDGLMDLMNGTFRFLNHAHRFGKDVDWHSRDVSHLWRYQLHYFGYALDLGAAYRATGDAEYYVKFKNLVESWDARNPVGSLDGWHAYTISIRTVNWVYARELFHSELKQDPEFDRKLIELLYVQFNFLSLHLEFQGLGNHLLANIRALLFGGCMFVGASPRRWLARAEHLLAREIDEQVPADGGHFERSSMYHLQVLKDLLECHMVLRRCGNGSLAEGVKTTVERMLRFIRGMIAPDGSMPLLNDSSYDLMPSPLEALLAAGEVFSAGASRQSRAVLNFLVGQQSNAAPSLPTEPFASTSFCDTGYFVMRGAREDMMVIDCGKVCPDYLPPHAHADTLTFDLWAGGVHFITDSGTYEYTAGEWRDYFRSTRAHNTVCVDGMDQSEVWASFRVARRANPGEVSWISTEDGDYFCGSHDGYLRLQDPVQHTRRILRVGSSVWLVLDTLSGAGHHHMESNIHFHPEVDLEPIGPGAVEVARQGRTLTLITLPSMACKINSGSLNPKQGWYSPEFGVRQPRSTISLTFEHQIPHTFGYILTTGKANDVEVDYQFGEHENYELTVGSLSWSIEVDRHTECMTIRSGTEKRN